jgi:hypothetical protein
MNGPSDSVQFVQSLVQARSFWEQTVPMFAVALILFAGCAWFVAARLRRSGVARVGTLSRSESGSAEALDFVLTFPLVTLTALMFAQLLLGGHASLVVHYSAYSAARAARAAFFDMTVTDITELRTQLEFTDTPVLQLVFGNHQGDADKLADTAARIALMNAVPTAVKYDRAPTGAALIMLNRTVRMLGNRRPTRKKAAYAFDPQNAQVDVSIVGKYEQIAKIRGLQGERVDAMPVRARVNFRYPLVMPVVANIFGTNGVFEMSAEVTLL